METNEFYDFIVKVQAISKIGLTYCKDPYAVENYKELRDLSNSMLENFMNIKFDKPSMFTKEIYPTPNVSCRTLILKDNKILLVREANTNLWSLPGGWCDLFESPSQAAFNEVSQEAGVEPEITRLLAVLDRRPHKTNQSVPEYLLVFEGNIDGKKFHSHCHETNNVEFFDLDSLPEMSKKTSKEELDQILDAYKNNKTVFD